MNRYRGQWQANRKAGPADGFASLRVTTKKPPLLAVYFGDPYGIDCALLRLHRLTGPARFIQLLTPSVNSSVAVEPDGFASLRVTTKKPPLLAVYFGDPYGIRTRITAVKGRCPNP